MLKLTYWLCALLSPLVMYMVYSIDDIADRDYRFSFYLLLMAVAAMSNALIVWITQSSLPVDQKLTIWRKSLFVTAISIVLLLLLAVVVVILLFGFSKWNFG